MSVIRKRRPLKRQQTVPMGPGAKILLDIYNKLCYNNHRKKKKGKIKMALIVLGILYLCGVKVGIGLAIVSIIAGIVSLAKTIYIIKSR